MDFENYMDIIARSGPADWNAETASIYVQTIPEAIAAGRDPSVSSHTFVFAYRKDLCITMAYGMLCREAIRAEWTEAFPDKRAAGRYLDFFYNSALVFRDVLVTVDNGQCVLP